MNEETQTAPKLSYVRGLDFVSRARGNNSKTGWAVFFGMPFVWTLPFIILSAILGAITGLLFFPLGIGVILAPMATFVLLYAVHRAVNESRRRNGRMIVGYLETAVRLNLPLVPFLTAAQLSERGRRARQIGHLRDALYAGLPVSSALAELPDIPEEIAGRVAAEESMGQLRHGVIRAVELDRVIDDERNENPDGPIYRLYPLFLLLSSWAIVTAIMIFVIPKFKEIFKDFKTALPRSTEILMSISSWVAEDYGWLLILPLFGIVVLLVSMFFTNIFLPGFRLPAFSQIWRWIAWRLPLARDLQRTHGMAQACDVLSTTIREGGTLPASLKSAELLDINPGFRDQLVNFREGIVAGVPAAQAADGAQLPPLLVGLLTTPTDSLESQSAMFAFLARHYRQRFSRTLLFIRSAIEPAFVLVFGAGVGFILYALFSPLVKLISSVAGASDGGVL